MLYRENGQFKTSYSADQQIFPILQDRIAMALLLAVAFVVVPLLGSEYMFRAIFIPFLILSLAALGLNILVGYCGQISLGTGAFMAVGAYAAYNFQVRIEGMPVLLSLLLGGVCATAGRRGVRHPVAAHQGPVPRRGHAGGAVLRRLGLPAHQVVHQRFDRRARSAWPTSTSSACPIETPVAKYLFCLSFLAVFGLLAKNLVRSHIGREWMAIRDMDVAAAVIGIRPVYAKLTAFAVSSFIVGVAGALWGFVYLGSWEPAAFSIDRSFQLLFMVIIGGLGSIMGSFFGAAFIVLLPILLDQLLPALGALVGLTFDTAIVSHVVFMIFGALIVFFLIAEPHGLARLWAVGQGKAAALAVPALSRPHRTDERSFSSHLWRQT